LISLGRKPAIKILAASAEPCEGAFDRSAAWRQFGALCCVGTLDDLQCPLAMALERVSKLVADLGSGLIDHNQKRTVAAMQMADMKVWAQRS